MAKLIYSGLISLDGYVADESGRFDWAMPDEEVHFFINDLTRSVGTHLLGRRMYETLAIWDRIETLPDATPAMLDFAGVWKSGDKIVFSRSLETVSTERTRLEREFDPDAVRKLKESASRDLAVGGPGLAAEAIRAGLVDEYHLFVAPVVVGGGTAFLPRGFRTRLELIAERRFGNGMVHLGYRALPGAP